MKYYFVSILILLSQLAKGQQPVRLIISDDQTKAPIQGVTIELLKEHQLVITDTSGSANISKLTDGVHTFRISSSGYQSQTITLTLPVRNPVEIFLIAEPVDMEAIIIQSTRTSRSFQRTPTRVETIDAEEVEEKANMRPGNVSMLLHESTGIQVQQVSATSGSASIRVQGLDGRYTQLLKDGYPNFGNFASGLSILEIPPLDLQQVEIIKGPASTLYGGGAIAGVINFVSKTPGKKPVYNFILNHSNIGQSNIGVYASQRKGKIGYTVLGLVNYQESYDADKDDFSEIPQGYQFTINPRLFIYPGEKSTVIIGNSFSKGDMKGGDMHVLAGGKDSGHVYFETNNSIRNTTSLEWEQKLNKSLRLKLKQSLSIFSRGIDIPGYSFAGVNTNSFTDVSFLVNKNTYTLVGGLNLVYDRFRQRRADSLDAHSFTSGLYLQHTWDISAPVKLESGLRFENAQYRGSRLNYGQFFVLPRVSLMVTINRHLTSRIGGGLGYKGPTIFTEQTEAMQYQQVAPLQGVRAERSRGATVDINYKTNFGASWHLAFNQLFFVSSIRQPMILQPYASGYAFANASRPVISKGLESNLKIIFKEDFKLFAGYTFTHARADYLPGQPFLPLQPRHKLNLALIYEKEQNLKLGLEAYFTGRQYLSNGTQAPAFWEFGFMAEKTFREKLSLFINFENFTDVRQSRYKRIVNGPNDRPSFDEIWTHLEGFTLNGGIKLRL